MQETLIQAAALIVPLIFAIVFHEVAHGWVARALGDPTAYERRRLSLNPLRHVDPVGTIVLPGALALASLPVFGWAKPVPVNKRRLNNPRFGMMAVAALWGGCLLLTARERGMIPAGPAWLDRTLWLVTYNPVLLFMGRISYAVYLIHIPVMAATVAVAAMVAGHLDRSVITIATFVSLPLVLLAATALYHLVEVTGIRMGSKVARRIGQRPAESTA